MQINCCAMNIIYLFSDIFFYYLFLFIFTLNNFSLPPPLIHRLHSDASITQSFSHFLQLPCSSSHSAFSCWRSCAIRRFARVASRCRALMTILKSPAIHTFEIRLCWLIRFARVINSPWIYAQHSSLFYPDSMPGGNIFERFSTIEAG